MNVSLLLPREKYLEVSKQYGPSPFTFEIKNSKQVLFYFGANHSHDPNNHQYPVLKKYWDEFLEVSSGKERIVLIEGGLRKLPENEQDAIRDGSEGGLITFFAHKENITIASPDIKTEELLKMLPDLDRKEALLYYFLSIVDNWRRHPEPRPNFIEYFNRWSKNQKQKGIWKEEDLFLSALKKSFKEIIGREFSERDNHNDLVNPNLTTAPTNAIARAQSDLRDLNIASEIERYWKEGKSIFVVFGSGHLIIQAPALKTLLT